MSIAENVARLRREIPDHVRIVAAAKTRSVDDIKAALDAGITDFGENYVQEAESIRDGLGDIADRATWHLIGHLQTNKVNKALALFDLIQTLDSLKLAQAIAKRTEVRLPVLIEINSGREPQKTGVVPEEAESLIREIAGLEKIEIRGLMTMGPRFGDPEEARPYFRETRKLFDALTRLEVPGVTMDILSMGMSNAYRIAIEEGSTMIRPGSILFSPRS